MRTTNKVTEAQRVMTICNACRYCEGHCAVFQAMELRLEFNADNLDYLANLCHNCGSCYHNCQYTAPHEFDLNVPAAMAELRQENYGVYAWPGFMGKLFANNGLWMSLLSIIVITSFFINWGWFLDCTRASLLRRNFAQYNGLYIFHCLCFCSDCNACLDHQILENHVPAFSV
ncbi:hypothetical protein MT390_17355 [Vibrio sp. 2-Bac 85]